MFVRVFLRVCARFDLPHNIGSKSIPLHEHAIVLRCWVNLHDHVHVQRKPQLQRCKPFLAKVLRFKMKLDSVTLHHSTTIIHCSSLTMSKSCVLRLLFITSTTMDGQNYTGVIRLKALGHILFVFHRTLNTELLSLVFQTLKTKHQNCSKGRERGKKGWVREKEELGVKEWRAKETERWR